MGKACQLESSVGKHQQWPDQVVVEKQANNVSAQMGICDSIMNPFDKSVIK